MGYKRPKQCWSTFPKNFLLVERATPAQFGPKLSDDTILFSENLFEML